jgi:hypothetical protein
MAYVMVNYHDRNRGFKGYQCLLRGSGQSLDDWRAWDGMGFTLEMGSPYVTKRDRDCASVQPFAVLSLKYVPALNTFVALGYDRQQVVYTFSEDLLKWSEPKVLMQAAPPQHWTSGGPPARAYFSFLDATSSSINFDTLEQKPYLYFVQLDRYDRRKTDLYRVALTIK